MVINNNLPNKEFVKSIDSSQLFYNGNGQGINCVSITTDLILS